VEVRIAAPADRMTELGGDQTRHRYAAVLGAAPGPGRPPLEISERVRHCGVVGARDLRPGGTGGPVVTECRQQGDRLRGGKDQVESASPAGRPSSEQQAAAPVATGQSCLKGGLIHRAAHPEVAAAAAGPDPGGPAVEVVSGLTKADLVHHEHS
jgi:hypothetical protein